MKPSNTVPNWFVGILCFAVPIFTLRYLVSSFNSAGNPYTFYTTVIGALLGLVFLNMMLPHTRITVPDKMAMVTLDILLGGHVLHRAGDSAKSIFEVRQFLIDLQAEIQVSSGSPETPDIQDQPIPLSNGAVFTAKWVAVLRVDEENLEHYINNTLDIERGVVNRLVAGKIDQWLSDHLATLPEPKTALTQKHNISQALQTFFTTGMGTEIEEDYGVQADRAELVSLVWDPQTQKALGQTAVASGLIEAIAVMMKAHPEMEYPEAKEAIMALQGAVEVEYRHWDLSVEGLEHLEHLAIATTGGDKTSKAKPKK